MMVRFKTVLLAATLVVGTPPAFAQETGEGGSVPETVVDREHGLEAWQEIYTVLSHPRCANCHVEDDRPRWSGPSYGPARVHGFNVQRGADGSGFGHPGLRCTSCHFETNAETPHGPPGAHGWHLAPADMVWFGKSSAEVCAQIKDPQRNGGRTLAEVATHVRDDALVAWGWAPGPGREPAPGSAEETFAALERWAAAGAPCPGA